MLDYKDVLQSLVARFAVANVVTVTETNFGYIIWSKKGGPAETLRMRIVNFGGAFALFSLVGMWVSPFNETALLAKVLISIAVISGLVAYAWFSRSNSGGIELHVDVGRREIRAASRTPNGECWIQSSSRFGEITGAMIVNSGGENSVKSLVLRIAGEDEPLPIAVGKESVLLAVHDRLMNDLRPLEQRLASFKLSAGRPGDPGRRVFPSLGPSEVSS